MCIRDSLYTILFIAFFGIGYGAYYATADMPIPMVADCSDYETYQSGKYIPGIMGTPVSYTHLQATFTRCSQICWIRPSMPPPSSGTPTTV